MKQGAGEGRRVKLWKILPGLARKGIMSNGTVYFPYFGAGIFSVFTFFIFSSIIHNDIIKILPRSGYAWVMLQIGKGLLGIILLPFLFYANSFLIKRRKNEIGLYSILGLEKSHIGILFLAETVFTYAVTLTGGIVSGTVLAKLLFLLLLRMTGLPVDVKFVFYPQAFGETAVFFFWVYAFNLMYNLMQVGKARPAELLSGGKRGEKEPRFLGFYAVAGVLTLGMGYRLSILSKMDSNIFINFFFAVFLVIVGTYLLFTSGSVAFLKVLKKSRKFYYTPSNFITVSGMLKRMKKNAASLVNICIFSTMVIITLICTSSLYLGLDGILYFNYPYDLDAYFTEEEFSGQAVENKLAELEEKYGLKIKERVEYKRVSLGCGKEGNAFRTKFTEVIRQRDNFRVYLLLADEYGRMENRDVALDENEVIIYSQAADFGYAEVDFMGKRLKVREELMEMKIMPKAGENNLDGGYVLIVRDLATMEELANLWAAACGIEEPEGVPEQVHALRIDLDGTAEEKEDFIEEFGKWCEAQPGYMRFGNNPENRKGTQEMMGGLLFIGILFSLIFFMCLILIMYYKQISEGFEDKEGFAVMKKVGMDGDEIRGTVHKQILLVFFLPLFGAVLHTAAGLFMVDKLFGAIYFFNTRLLVSCAAGTVLVFGAIYGLSYLYTARTYYGIVSGE